MKLLRFWYVRIAPSWELYVEFTRGDGNGHRKFFETARDAGELHIWIGQMKLEICKSVQRDRGKNGISNPSASQQANDWPLDKYD
ncbi:hypothetical protein GCM10011587_04180 [Pyruvatibacter mobilis]|nr:hypothetical protein GCM10011587_04180 [Pyruvatibacter mobilis]